MSHLWIGLAFGLYFSLLGLTGSTLIFKTELNYILDPAAQQVKIPARAVRVPIDLLVRNFKEAHPGEKITSIILPEISNQTISVVYRPESDKSGSGPKKPDARQCFFDPYSGAMVADKISGGEFFNFVKKLHTRLLLDDFGKELNSYGVLFIFVLLVSGLWLWWPTINKSWGNFLRHLKLRTSIKLDGKFKRIVFDTHNAVGFYSSALLMLFALTAMTALWRDQSAFVLSALTASTVVGEKKARPFSEPTVFSFDQALSSAKNFLPDDVPILISGDLQVTMARPQSHFFYPRLSVVILDPQNGSLKSIEKPQDKTLGQLILNSAMPVHFGQWGPGLAYNPVKCLWVLAGLCPFTLCLSGFLMYFEKEKSKKESVAKKMLSKQIG